MSSHGSLPAGTIEIIKDKLYFAPGNPPPPTPSHKPYVAFTNDPSLVYTAFFADFGPLDLGLTVKFCRQLEGVYAQATGSGEASSGGRASRDRREPSAVVYYYGDSEHSRANSAVLLLAFLLFVLNMSVEQAYAPFIGLNPPFVTYRDAGFCLNTFPITVLDCAQAMSRALACGHFSYRAFSLDRYQHLQQLQNGDVSWIVPGKFIAFSGPLPNRRKLSATSFTLTPDQYVPLFKSLGVTCVVRFNDKLYDKRVFTGAGIKHVDLFYEDGGNPPDEILNSFLKICEAERGAIAVHCKAGLGRTGTNIAAYMMKHYGYTARETIAWCRLCRPGCIVGPQQQYLVSIEERMFAEGERVREKERTMRAAAGALPSLLKGADVGSSRPSSRTGSRQQEDRLRTSSITTLSTNSTHTNNTLGSQPTQVLPHKTSAHVEHAASPQMGSKRSLSAVRAYRSGGGGGGGVVEVTPYSSGAGDSRPGTGKKGSKAWEISTEMEQTQALADQLSKKLSVEVTPIATYKHAQSTPQQPADLSATTPLFASTPSPSPNSHEVYGFSKGAGNGSNSMPPISRPPSVGRRSVRAK